MKWAYGITTVPQRIETLLPKTLKSLAAAGFDQPRLFMDGNSTIAEFGLEATYRNPPLKAYGNWFMALAELFIRHPQADRYALFQDDLIAVKNLRSYLEKTTSAPKTYWNLFTITNPERRQTKPPEGRPGWYKSNQLGKGALGLVFQKDAVIFLLSSGFLLRKFQCTHRPDRNIDGAISEDVLCAHDWTELIHNPSLLQHTGLHSAISEYAPQHQKSFCDLFPGEDFDALSLLGANS